MALPASPPITLLQIQAEFPAVGPGLSDSLSYSAFAAGVSANMLAFLGRSSFTPTLYDYATTGVYTWTKPSGCNYVEAICIAGGGGGGGTDGYGDGGGGGAGQAYYFINAVTANMTIIVGSGGTGRVNAQGNGGNPSAMSGGGISVGCTGGYAGYQGTIGGGGGAGGQSGNGNAGGEGNPDADTDTDGGGGGGNSGVGKSFIEYGLGGPGNTYTLNNGAYSYTVSYGGNSGSYRTATNVGYYGSGGNGAHRTGVNAAGQAGASGRVVFYATV